MASEKSKSRNPLPFELSRLGKRLRNTVGAAVGDYGMIADGDKIMVCLSGGKDSYTMLDMLMALKVVAPIDFDLVAVNLDQKQPDFPETILPDYLRQYDVPFKVVEQDTYSIVKRVIPDGKTTCGLCSRLRRGILYRTASKLGCTKIALGHHREDIIETFFLNLFYAGKLKAMPPKLVSDDGNHVVIRPLAYCEETDIEKYAQERAFPIIPCNLCGSQPNMQREAMGEMMKLWEKKNPGRVESVFRALKNVIPSHLADAKLFDFPSLVATGEADENGDKAFDADESCGTPVPNKTAQKIEFI
jgi:tRNA 2-thiocytidine biosynthesis protein TtcA